MAKKKNKKNTRQKTKKNKRPGMSHQMMKVIGALAVLILFVVAAATTAHLMFQKTKNSLPKAKVKKSAPMVSHTPKPTYEVYPKKAPPPKPITKPPQVGNKVLPPVAIVIDDIGYDQQIAHQLLSIDAPLTFSILPHGPFSHQLAVDARKKGHEIMLHLPMEPREFPDINPGPGALLKQMSPDELIGQLKSHLDLFPGLKGVNNHMGSGISTSPEHMRQIFSILKMRGLYYIDSRTTAETVARPSAQLLQLPFAERDIFIDHREDEKFIRNQLKKLIQRAQKQGYAVGIGHPHTITHRMLTDFLPHLKKKVRLVPASIVVEAEMQAISAETAAHQ